MTPRIEDALRFPASDVQIDLGDGYPSVTELVLQQYERSHSLILSFQEEINGVAMSAVVGRELRPNSLTPLSWRFPSTYTRRSVPLSS